MPGPISVGRPGRQGRAASLPYSVSTNCSRTSRCWESRHTWAPSRNAATSYNACLANPALQAAALDCGGKRHHGRLALETAAAGANLTSTGRQSLSSSVSVAERDAWFGPRLAHLTTFLKDQACTPTGRRPQARAAAITEESPNSTAATEASEMADDTQPHPAAPDTLPGPPAVSVVECRIRLARADLIDSMEGRDQPKKAPLPPPGVHQTQDAQRLLRLPQHEGPVQPVTLGLDATWPHSVYGEAD